MDKGKQEAERILFFEPIFNTRPSQANGLAPLAPLRGNSSNHWKNASQASRHGEYLADLLISERIGFWIVNHVDG